ncbi:MAG: TIGR03084 family metal-binding protein [Mycobacteriaceae bacterium]
MTSALQQVLADLAAENDDLDYRVAGLDRAGWARATPAEGWTIAHQIAHLAWTDQTSLLAATDEDAFAAALQTAAADPTGFVDDAAAEGAALPPAQLLAHWRSMRQELIAALGTKGQGDKLPWFGPPMSPTSMATARLMETWAHGQDVADALGQVREPTDRLRHVCHIGVRTRGFAFLLNGLPVPAADVRVELSAPNGDVWSWGESDTELVRGPALDFCQLVTQRRHLGELALQTTGEGAAAWLPIAQAFAGPPGGGRPPRAQTAEPSEEQQQ